MMIDIASITSRGQFTIPSRLCKFLNLKAGSKMFIVTDGEHLLLKKLAPPDVAAFGKIVRVSKMMAKKAKKGGRP